MDITKMFVRDGKVVFKQVAETCGIENGEPAHIFNKGPQNGCDCGHHKSFYHAQSEGLNPEPIAVRGHLKLYQGGKV